MQVAIITQDERLYLPYCLEPLLKRVQRQISCVLVISPLSTHGSKLIAFRRHLALFGAVGVARLLLEMAFAHVAPRIGVRAKQRPPWSVWSICDARGIPVFKLNHVQAGEFDRITRAHPADLLISVSCPVRIPDDVLLRFKAGAINAHSAPLPRYGGLMPTFWVLRHGETRTAVTVHEMTDRLDGGAILHQEVVEIHPKDTWASLTRKTKRVAANAIADVIARGLTRDWDRRPNRSADATYFSFPTRKDRRAFLARGRRFF